MVVKLGLFAKADDKLPDGPAHQDAGIVSSGQVNASSEESIIEDHGGAAAENQEQGFLIFACQITADDHAGDPHHEAQQDHDHTGIGAHVRPFFKQAQIHIRIHGPAAEPGRTDIAGQFFQ